MKKIVVVIPSDVVAKTLHGSGALSELNRNFALHYLMSPNVTECLDAPSTRIGLGYRNSKFLSRLDFLFWYAELFHFLKSTGEDLRENYKFQNLSRVWRNVCRVFSWPSIIGFSRWLDRKVFVEDRGVAALLRELGPDLVIMPGSALDSYSFLVGRSARQASIPTLAIITHWDHFSKKNLFRFVPDKVYLWGTDMLESALRYGGHDVKVFAVVGAPQFQKYISGRRDRLNALRTLGLDANRKWLLYAAPSVPFDDLSLLARIDHFIESKGLKDFAVVYRPHPRAHPRKTRYQGALTELHNVVVDSYDGSGHELNEHYLNLLSATSGLITPWSTMVLEYGLLGSPSLCVSFSDAVNYWDWGSADRAEHIVPILARACVQNCKDDIEFEHCLSVLIKQTEDIDYCRHVKNSIAGAIYSDAKTYAERLKLRIESDFFEHQNP